MTQQEQQLAAERQGKRIAVACFALVVGMVGLSYAAVPLYQLFCQVTGYGGTTQQAEAAPDHVLERTMTVQFDANTRGGFRWDFKPGHGPMKVHVGEPNLAYYEAHNPTDQTLVGTAIFNVSPPEAGYYFTKIECFCFTEQVLKPGETVKMPVSFFIDPEIEEEPDLDRVKVITLSYTFYPKQRTAALD